MEKPKGRKLRTGYTTGACAAAASKAAAQALLNQKPVDAVTITLPKGQQVTFQLERCDLETDWAECSIIKDAGDDPDVTHGAEIVARVAWSKEPGLALEGGVGVGVVTRQGVGLTVGGPAINPVPQQMITASVEEAVGHLNGSKGLRVTISVPKGEELAKKTLNARLGIIGGISILGTTGIVRPFSTSAWRASVLQAISVAAANECPQIVLTTGGRSEKYAMALLPDLQEVAFVEMGDFVGAAVRQAVKHKMQKVTICGMIGKLSKMAQGVVQTHASGSSVDTVFLSELAAEVGAPAEVCDQIRGNPTARFFSEKIQELGLTKAAHDRICELTCQHLRAYVKNALALECILTDFEKGEVLGRASLG